MQNNLGKEYHNNGFACVKGLFLLDEVRLMKAEIIRILEKLGHHGGISVGLAANSELFRTYSEDPRLLDCLERIIGSNIEFLSDKVAFKSAKVDFPSPWHQDWSYWHGAHKLSVWIALDAATPENGCLKLLPGSHLSPVIHDGSAPAEEGFGQRIRPDLIDESKAFTGTCEPGDAIFFHDLTLHASFPNSSAKDRMALISTYRSASIPDETYAWAVAAKIVRGSRG